MASIFTKIIEREIPADIIAEDDSFIAFLDINPNAKGHTLVVPKKEVDYLFDLDAETYQNLFNFSKRVALALEKVIPCKRVGLSVVGLEVPHVHVHLIPLNSMKDTHFERRIEISREEIDQIKKEFGTYFNS